MASLTYESQDRVAEGVSHYFPTWYIEECPIVHEMDWSRFLMLTSEDHQTTVISVRGTVTFRDVLQDVSLWLVPSLMSVLDKVGPGVSSGEWGKAVARMSNVIPTAQSAEDTTFKQVLEATDYMLQRYPERLIYLTGHSLGGGIAKLVGLELHTKVACCKSEDIRTSSII